MKFAWHSCPVDSIIWGKRWFAFRARGNADGVGSCVVRIRDHCYALMWV